MAQPLVSPKRLRVLLTCMVLAAGSAIISATPVAASVNLVTSWTGYGSGTSLFNNPTDIAVSSTGNVYVADRDNNRIQEFDSTGTFLRSWGTSGSNNGQFNQPVAVALDSSNNVYVADSGNTRVQKFTSTGTFTVAWGTSGPGPGQFLDPTGIAVDSSNNVYVVDNALDWVQKFSSTGTYLTEFSGYGSGNGQLNSPNGIDVDSSGNIYIADTGNNRVEKFNSSFIFVSNLTSVPFDGNFSGPRGVAVDSSGNVYVDDNGKTRIAKFDSSGNYVTEWGGNGSCDGQVATTYGVAVGPSGTVYVADTGNDRIVSFQSGGTFVANLGGTGSGGLSFSSPEGITTDSSGNVYVVDSNNNRLGKFSGSGVLESTWGGGSGGCTDNDHFTAPLDAAVSSSGFVYVPDSGGDRVQKFDSNGNFLLSWGSTGSGNGQFHYPSAVAVDASGNVYVADSGSSRIEKFTSTGTYITSWGSAGSGNSQFIVPAGIAIDSLGNVYVTDSENANVQKFSATGSFITSWGTKGSAPGQFNEPGGIAIDLNDNVYVADTNNHRIEKFSSSGTFLTSWGSFGAGSLQFENPHDVAVDNAGNVFVADSGNGRIDKYQLTGPTTPTITSSSPASPGNSTTPKLIGTAAAAATVAIYTTSNCSGSPLVTGTGTAFASPGLAVTVTANTSTTFYARATDSGGTSACSSGFTYVENQAPPSAPTISSVTPASPANNNLPKVIGTAAAGTTVKIYGTSDCSGSALASGTAATFASPGIAVTVADNSVTTFYATASNTNGQSTCSGASSTYTEDSAAPAAPTIASSSPASPANNNSPKLIGTAEAGSTVGIYTTSDCSGLPTFTGSAATFASPGISTSIPDNTTRVWRATATDAAGNKSACSAAFTYTEDSTAPAAPSIGSIPNSPSSNDHPSIAGVAESGSTVKIYKTVDCSGSPLTSGTAAVYQTTGFPVTVTDNTTTTFYATATDAVGNVSPCSSGYAYTEDSTKPPAPTITSSSPSSPADNTTPFLIGTAEAGTTVRIYQFSPTCSANLDASGTAAQFASGGLQVTVTTDSIYTFYATATDASNNVSACSPAFTYRDEHTAPFTPTVDSITPDAPFSAPKNYNTPVVSGTAAKFSTVKLYTTFDCSGAVAGTAIADNNFSYSIQVTVPDDSTTTFYAQATNSIGTSACSSSSITYVEKSTPPSPPTWFGTSPATGNTTSKTLGGSGAANSTVAIYTTSTCTGTAVATGASTPSFSIPVTVASNSVTTFYATTTDAAGNVSGCSTSGFTYIEDEIAPSIPTITTASPFGNPSSFNTPRLQGTSDAGTLVQIYKGSGCPGGASGWYQRNSDTVFTDPLQGIVVSVLDNSTNKFSANAVDAAGNISGCSGDFTYVEDSTPPATPSLTSSSPASPSTNNSPKLIGSAEAGSTVKVYTTSSCSGSPVATGSAAEFANPGLTVSVMNNTSSTFKVTATDAAANVSSCSSGLTYTDDASAPSAPTISSSSPASPANNNSPKVVGSAEAGSTVRIYTNSNCLGTAVATGSAATFGSPGLAVSVNDNTSTTYYGTATDGAGNVSNCSSGFTYVEDSTAPGTPTISSSNPASGSNNNSPKLFGSAEAGSTVKLYPTSDCSGSPAASGNAASFASPGITVSVSDNTSTTFYATATDAAGNVSPCSTGLTYNEVSGPSTPTINSSSPASPANNNSPKLVGTADSGSTVKIYTTSNCSGSPVAADTAANFASPGITVGVADDTTTTFYATATNASNVTSSCSAGLMYVEDSTPPATPSISSSSPVSPANNNLPKLIGTAAAGSTVKIYTASNCSGSPVATGTATAFASPGLTVSVTDNTTTTFYATATDTANNASTCSSGLTYVEDSAAPSAPTISSSNPTSPANNNSPKLVGSAEAGSTVKIYTTSNCSGSPVATGTAAAFASPGIAVSVSDNTSTTYYATATDAAANLSGCSTGLTYVEDSTAPAMPTISSSSPGSPANNNAPKLIGTAEAGSTVKIYTTSNCSGSAVATGSAASFASPGIPVSVADNSTATFYATASDAASNTSTCSTGLTYVEDSTAPAAPSITSSNPASPANNNSPKLIGNAEAGSTVNIYPTSNCSGSPVATGTAATFASPGIAVAVSDNTSTTFYATAMDAVGNTSNCSTGLTYVEDSTAPAAPALTSSNPLSPANNNAPQLIGTAEAGSTVNVFTTSDCSGSPVATGTAAALASPGLGVSVADNSTTTYYATATDAATNVSSCSSGFTYVEDSAPPAAPTISSSNPASPANNSAPKLIGTAEAAATVKIYTASDCSGSSVATGTAASFSSPGVAVSVAANSTTTFYATASDAAGNVSACSSPGFSYTDIATGPSVPTISSSNPASPANANSPALIGSSDTGSTVSIFTTSNCSGSPVATGSAASFASPGISVSVADNSTTTFYASAKDVASNTSGCSTGFTYVEDSSAPTAPTISSSNPASPATSTSPKLIGSAEVGSTVKIYTTSNCSGSPVASGTAAAFASPGITVTVATNSTTTFYATATDVAANVSGCSTGFSYAATSTSDTTKPTVTLTTPVDGATYTLNQVVVALYSCSDNVAVKSCTGTVTNGAHVATGAVGSHAFAVTATDTSNNQATTTVHYTVVYPFSFGPALLAPPSVNSAAPGKKLKIFFSLGGNHGLKVLTGLAKSAPINCSTHVVTGAGVTTGVSAVAYNATKKMYYITWLPKATWANTCRQFTVSVADGTTHTVYFHIT